MLSGCLFSFSAPAFSQSVDVDFGSTFSGLDGLYYANELGARYQVGNDAVMAVGYFGDIGVNSSFSDYLGDFNMLVFAPFVGNTLSNGYITASGNFTENVIAEDPYIFIFSGISDYADAASANSFSIFSDSGWSFSAPASPTPSETTLLAFQPDTILIGDFLNVADGFQLNAAPVPEPSHFALAFGLIGLGVVVWRRRRERG